MARLDAGQEVLERTAVPIATVLSEVETEMADALARKRQQLVRQIAPDAGVVSADPAKLHDVLRNLIENAINYGPEESTIDVSTTAAGPHVVIAVADRGPGIPTSDLPRVFERFYRVDRSRTRDPGGTGLGLTLCKRLVGLMGGEIGFHSQQHHGSTFFFTLPCPQNDALHTP